MPLMHALNPGLPIYILSFKLNVLDWCYLLLFILVLRKLVLKLLKCQKTLFSFLNYNQIFLIYILHVIINLN